MIQIKGDSKSHENKIQQMIQDLWRKHKRHCRTTDKIQVGVLIIQQYIINANFLVSIIEYDSYITKHSCS